MEILSKVKGAKKHTAFHSKNKTKERFNPNYIAPHIKRICRVECECAICKEKIKFIEESFFNKESDELLHLECVINEIRKENKITDNQKISYIGSGKFIVFEKHNNKYNFLRTIEWERIENLHRMQKEIESLKQ